MTAPVMARPAGSVELARALADVRHLSARQWTAARDYADAVAAEGDALVAYAFAIADGAGEDEVRAAREVLAHTLGRRDDAGRRLGLNGQPPEAIRVVRELLDAARAARVGSTETQIRVGRFRSDPMDSHSGGVAGLRP